MIKVQWTTFHCSHIARNFWRGIKPMGTKLNAESKINILLCRNIDNNGNAEGLFNSIDIDKNDAKIKFKIVLFIDAPIKKLKYLVCINNINEKRIHPICNITKSNKDSGNVLHEERNLDVVVIDTPNITIKKSGIYRVEVREFKDVNTRDNDVQNEDFKQIYNKLTTPLQYYTFRVNLR